MAKEKSIGIIGGSGLYKIDGVEVLEIMNVNTPFGRPSSPIFKCSIDGKLCYFLARHGTNHSLLPHEVNYRANIYALKSVGVEYLVSVSAVGSLREDLPPRHFFLPDQFIDWTKGQRKRSFFGDEIIAHVSVANPVDMQLRNLIDEKCAELNIPYKKDGSYICIEGPQFSSKAESNIYRSFGASVIGMTNVPESYLAKEAGLAYATVAMVTDFDCWKDEHCTVDEIMKVMADNNVNATKLIKSIVPHIANNKFDVVKENRIGLMTPIEKLRDDQKSWVSVLMA